MKKLGLLVSLLPFTHLSGVETALPDRLPAAHWSITQAEIGALPNGGHVAGLLEFLYQPAVMANTDTAGFARAENAQIGMLGESYKWQRWYLGGADISHPSRPGEPLLYLPLAALSQVQLQKYGMLQTDRNGVHMTARDVEKTTAFGQLSLPFQVGGPALIPRATADREPASDWGAPTQSRGFAAGSAEAHALFRLAQIAVPAYIFADAYYARRFFNLLPNAENAGEATLIGAFNPQWLSGDRMHVAIQARSRQNLHAEYFISEAQTFDSGQLSALTQYNFVTNTTQGALAIGYSYRNLAAKSSWLSRSVTDEPYQAPPLLPEKTHTVFFDASGLKRIPKELADLEYGVNSRFEFENRRTKPGYNRLVETLYGTPLAVTLYDGPASEANFLLRWQPFLRAVRKNARSEFSASGNFHIDWGFTDAGTKLGFVHPAAKLAARSFVGASAFFVSGAVLHDTLGFTLQEVSFLNPDALSGTRYNFSDTNGNGEPESGELGSFSRTGGKYHSAQTGLQAPQKEELNLGLGYAGSRDWRFELNLNGRIYRRLLEVRYADGAAPTFTPSAAGGSIATFDKTATGNEYYVLRNAEKDAYYAHAEISLIRLPENTEWIFRGSVGAYYATGYTPHGLNMFYNDLGAYNESTADPNFRENRFARIDSERGYIGKLQFGRRFAKLFSVTNVLRYRDGEPMAGYRVITGMAQGPLVLPFEERGGGITGVGRHTYSLALDLRFRLDTVIGSAPAWAFLDIYNLLNSRTELAEYPIAGTRFRDPIEQGVARTMRLGFGMNF
jgi:hypothetical protein